MNPSPALVAVLERARRLGVLGPGPVEDHIAHAAGFVQALESLAPGSVVVDLGSGAGVPGLVVVDSRPDLEVVLLDAMEKRTALLEDAIVAMDAGDRASVVLGRAEVLGRHHEHRGMADAVTARSFGSPAATAECAAPLLRPGGTLIVSEPPEGPDRWPADGLARLGMAPGSHRIPGIQVIVQTLPCPDEFPRRDGVPAKRPPLLTFRRAATTTEPSCST